MKSRKYLYLSTVVAALGGLLFGIPPAADRTGCEMKTTWKNTIAFVTRGGWGSIPALPRAPNVRRLLEAFAGPLYAVDALAVGARVERGILFGTSDSNS